MFHIIGLGNPGTHYTETPHNIGRELLRRIHHNYSLDFSQWETDKHKQSWVSSGSFDSAPHTVVELLLSTNYMNQSGQSLRHVENNMRERVVVLYDDIDLPFGTVRIAFNRGSGGHNGIKSIEQVLGSKEFVRVRIGVCPLDWFGRPRKPKTHQAVQSYLVDKRLSSGYLSKYDELARTIGPMLESIVSEGHQVAMNRFNAKY